MGRAARAVTAGMVVIGLCAIAGPGAVAKPSGTGPGNKPNAKACQKGGWQNLVRSDGTAFASEEQCVSYAAKGGVLQPSPRWLCEQALAEAGLTAPADAGWILGTPGDDDFTSRVTGGNEIICGFGGNDTIRNPGGVYLWATDVFLGGAGDDHVERMEGGTFLGGEGDDSVALLINGTFGGGTGADSVQTQLGGTFDAGAGGDYVSHIRGGTFNGGTGNDRLGILEGGTFNGGEDADLVRLSHDPAGTFYGGAGDDRVDDLTAGGFDGGDGDDSIGTMWPFGTWFRGGPGCDRIERTIGTPNADFGDQSTCPA